MPIVASRHRTPASQETSHEKRPVVMLSRTALIAIIVVLAIIAAGSLGRLLYQHNKAGTVEIHLDKNGLRIEEN